MYKNHIWLLKNAESSAYLESSSESVRSDGPEPKYLHQNSKLEWRWDGTLEENTNSFKNPWPITTFCFSVSTSHGVHLHNMATVSLDSLNKEGDAIITPMKCAN